MDHKFQIMDMQGVLHYKDIPLVDFKIFHTKLIYARDLSKGSYYPCEMFLLGLTYEAFCAFFNERVVREHAQWVWDYLHQMGLGHYDFEELIKKMNGWDATGFHWVKFPDMGAKCWEDIVRQKYPIY